ncbi:hypothetical protein NPIL_691941 [Nephila pilipes]|uniref:Uncharacterized protein n=1 Tax=Nephila pilipes TaxID=299642 RepID=A0A8X6TPF0_NEPPI|nr:hypothetical protein NPIL_691941 [Nephila pilipes]
MDEGTPMKHLARADPNFSFKTNLQPYRRRKPGWVNYNKKKIRIHIKYPHGTDWFAKNLSKPRPKLGLALTTPSRVMPDEADYDVKIRLKYGGL